MGSINGGLYTSGSSEWRTPPDLFKRCSERWGPFDLDVAASHENALATPLIDGLSDVWHGRCWMNPPYGREIGDWIFRAWEEVIGDCASRVVALLPARTDTRWWQDYIEDSPFATVHFLRGRVKFLDAQGKPQGPAPFPSAIVVFERPFE